MRSIKSLLFFGLCCGAALAQAQDAVIQLHTLGGDAWTYAKELTGTVKARSCDAVHVESPRGHVVAALTQDQFVATVPLAPGTNDIVATCLRNNRSIARTPPQRWVAKAKDAPRAWIRIHAAGDEVIFNAGGSIRSPAAEASLTAFEWFNVESARQQLRATYTDNTCANKQALACEESLAIKRPAADGEYALRLRVTDARGISDDSIATFTVRNGRVELPDLARDHPSWVDSAVIYGVVPFFFDGFAGVSDRLDEIKDVGVNTLWISPVTAASEDDFGYAPVDHFRLRNNFGSEDQFRVLISRAHELGLKVIIDFVPNHFSERHPYYVHAEQHGKRSPYHDWFDRDDEGNVTGYFDWSNLKNLNYDNPEVRTHMTEAFSHWLRTYDVDGFRVDASWGIAQRAPEFWSQLRTELKRIKPDILLLAEASARDPFHIRNGFDAAYDWTDNLGEWAWKDVFHDERTVPDLDRLRSALTNGERGFPADSHVFRFINNNDTGERFITRYGLPYTRLASTLLFTLPGMPLVYNGDEVGAEFEPYDEGPPIVWNDRHGLTAHYQALARIRREQPALRSESLRLIETRQDDVVLAFERLGDRCESNVMTLLNFSRKPVTVSITDTLPASEWRDLLSGHSVRLNKAKPRVNMAAHSAMLLQPARGCERR